MSSERTVIRVAIVLGLVAGIATFVCFHSAVVGFCMFVIAAITIAALAAFVGIC